MIIEILIGLTLFSVIGIICFIATISYQKVVTGDIYFSAQKLKLMLMTLAMVYLIIYFSQGDITRKATILPEVGVGDKGVIDMIFAGIPFVVTMLYIILCLWFAASIAFLPLTHTVTDVKTLETDENYTNAFSEISNYVYIYPFQIVNFVFGITLVLFIWKCCYEYIFSHELKLNLVPESLEKIP